MHAGHKQYSADRFDLSSASVWSRGPMAPAMADVLPLSTYQEIDMTTKKLSGFALASAAALVFATATISTASADEAKVKCEGVNSCKGTSACKTASHSCKGQNSCKGQGYLEMSKADCDAAKAKQK
jgi:hypothetical protein